MPRDRRCLGRGSGCGGVLRDRAVLAIVCSKRCTSETSRRQSSTPAAAWCSASSATRPGIEIEAARVRFVGHHWAHAVSAFHQSGFDRALVISFDGQGEGISGMVFSGSGGRLDHLRSMAEPDSLGYLYRDVIRFLGYEMFDEYKVMGMAPYGDPARYRQAFRAFYELLPDGAYRLHLDRVAGLYRLTSPRRKGEAFSARTRTSRRRCRRRSRRSRPRRLARRESDRAPQAVPRGRRRAQLLDERPARHLRPLRRRLRAAGRARRRAARSGRRSPWSWPSGRGRAWRRSRTSTGVRRSTTTRRSGGRWHAGPAFSPPSAVPTSSSHTARLLADGKVVGWVQGRSEFGPRALGNRSILADPRPAEHKERINAMVKKREGYRPFAPSVLEDRAGEFFVLPPLQTALPLHDRHRRRAARTSGRCSAPSRTWTAPRGSRRVARGQNPRYHALIEAFGRLTGVPILLNTSFNNHAEPIVDSLEDAIACFLTTDLHYLVAGEWLVAKREINAERVAGRARGRRADARAARGAPRGRLAGVRSRVRLSPRPGAAREPGDVRAAAGGGRNEHGARAGRRRGGCRRSPASWSIWTVRMVRLTPRT